MMRILLVHNAYQHYGGEDAVCASERALLVGAGHVVELLHVSNDIIKDMPARVALGVIYSRNGRRIIEGAIDRFRPDIVHVHNHFPLISPSLFDATSRAGVPSIWTLHNFRIACANGLLFRDGAPCEDCLGSSPLPALMHRCYRGSLAGSAVVAASIAFHNARGTWQTKVSHFIALNEFARGKFIEAGLPAEKLVVKPNFTHDPRLRVEGARSGAVYVGRLSVEKGVETLISAWSHLDQPLTIVGDGPLRARLEAAAPPHVHFAGHQDKQTVQRLIASAHILVVPSIWYETFGLVVAEAYALGTPVIASDIGSLRSIVQDGVTGYLFCPGDAGSLHERVRSAFQDTKKLRDLGMAARALYLDQFTPDRNLEMLEAIYEQARSNC